MENLHANEKLKTILTSAFEQQSRRKIFRNIDNNIYKKNQYVQLDMEFQH